MLLACTLQFNQLGRDQRFHPDEAHFMTFARNAAVKGDWLLPGALDKPPLSIYLSALSMVGIGVTTDSDGVLQLDPLVGEFAGRLPNVMLAVLLVALLMRLAGQITSDDSAAILAGLLAACSPYLLAFGATAFTDMSLLFCLALALLSVQSRQFGKAGLALGLAFFCKQQALLLLPLFALLLHRSGARRSGWRRGTSTFLGMVLLLMLWDGARPETSLFLLGAANNAPQTWIAQPVDWLPRLAEWARLALWLVAAPVVTLLLMAVAALGCLRADGITRAPRAQRHTETIFLIYIVAYIAGHTVFTFNQYDRYLLPLLPMVVIVLSARLSRVLRRLWQGKRFALTMVFVLISSAFWSVSFGLPIVSDGGGYDGIDELARYLESKPVATVIYDPWLGWELGYYLDIWHNKRRVHYPNPQELVRGALALDEIGDRYLVARIDQPHYEWLQALTAAGFAVNLDYERDHFVVYRLAPDWAVSD